MAVNSVTGNTLLSTGALPPCRAATTGLAIALSGLQTIDGVALIAGDRVLVKDQADPTTNGIYAVSSGNWVRTTDAASNTQYFDGMVVVVSQGTLSAGQIYLCTTPDDPVVIGASALTFQLQSVVAAASLVATSATAQTIGTGPMTFVTQANKVFTAGQWVTIASRANPLNTMVALITSYVSTPGVLGVSVSTAQGTGSHSDWNIIPSGPPGPIGLPGVPNLFDSRTLAAATVIPAPVNYLRTAGYSVAGDGGGSLYKRVVSLPAGTNGFQSADGAWWLLDPDFGIYAPEMFGAAGDGVTSDSAAINLMFESVPWGATCLFAAKSYRVTKTAGTNYGIRLRRSIRLLGTLAGGTAGTSAIVYDNSFDSLTHVFLIQVPGNSATPNAFAFYGLEIGNLYFVPFAASLGFQLTLFTWDPTKEYCLYARDVVHFDLPSTFGGAEILNSWIHDLYIFGSGGPGGGQGTGVSFNITCDPASGGWFGNIVERIHTSGGILVSQIGDSNTFRDILMDGKSGLTYQVKDGAVETLFQNFNAVCLQQAIYGRGGSKIIFDNWNIEAHGAQVGKSPDNAIIDIPNDLTTFTSAIEFNRISIGDQTFTTGGAGTQYGTFIYLQNCISPVFKRCQFYSSQPLGGPFASEAIRLANNVFYARLDGPFTRQSATTIPALVADLAVGSYGAEQTPGGNANALIAFNAAWTNGALTFRKDSSGFVALHGHVLPTGAFTSGAVLTMPVGFQPDRTINFITATDTGTAIISVTAAGLLTLVTATGGSPTRLYLDGVRYKDASHDALITIY